MLQTTFIQTVQLMILLREIAEAQREYDVLRRTPLEVPIGEGPLGEWVCQPERRRKEAERRREEEKLALRVRQLETELFSSIQRTGFQA